MTAAEDTTALIAPCGCKGSIRYVHARCLNQWRTSSRTNFYLCMQCGVPYKFPRSFMVLAQSSSARALFTMAVYTGVLLFLSRYLTHVLPSREAPTLLDRPLQFFLRLPILLFRHALDLHVWGRPASDEKWLELYSHPTQGIFASRRFHVALGYIGLLESFRHFPSLVFMICLLSKLPLEKLIQSNKFFKVIFTALASAGIAMSILDVTSGVRSLALTLKKAGTERVQNQEDVTI